MALLDLFDLQTLANATYGSLHRCSALSTKKQTKEIETLSWENYRKAFFCSTSEMMMMMMMIN